MYNLQDNLTILINTEKQLSGKPRLLISDLKLLITTDSSVSELYNHLNLLVGSKEDWLPVEPIDTFGFNKQNGELEMLFLYYPELNLPISSLSSKIIHKKIGLPQIEHPVSNFPNIKPFPYRYFNEAKNILICYNDIYSQQFELEEIYISKDTSLIFSKGTYCAWSLRNPELYLSDSINLFPTHESSSFLKEMFKRSFDLISTNNIKLMEEKNIFAYNQVYTLHNTIVKNKEYNNNQGLNILKNCLFNIIDKFYDDSNVLKN